MALALIDLAHVKLPVPPRLEDNTLRGPPPATPSGRYFTDLYTYFTLDLP